MTISNALQPLHFARWVVPIAWLGLLQACAAVPASHTLVPSSSTDKALQALSLKNGAVADTLTVSGEEHFFLISSSTDQTLSGRAVNPVTGELLPDQIVRDPFDSLALVYYADPAKRKVDPRSRVPLKPSYPALAGAGAREQAMPCDTLTVQLDRAEAVRWFARNEGAMAYTSTQQAQRHSLNAAKYAGKALLVVVLMMGCSSGGCDLPIFNNSSTVDPTQSLAVQIGEQTLRWAVSAADSRIIGLLKLRRDKQCAALPTLVGGQSDLQILAALNALGHDAGGGTSEEATLQKQTQLLDELGPRSLLGASNRKCGVLDCGIMRATAGSSQNQPFSITYEHVTWYAGTSNITSIKTMSQGKEGTVVVTDHSIAFHETTSRKSPPAGEIDVPYSGISSVEYKGTNGLDVWRAVITRTDGNADAVSFLGAGGPWRTEEFAELVSSRMYALAHAPILSVVPGDTAPH